MSTSAAAPAPAPAPAPAVVNNTVYESSIFRYKIGKGKISVMKKPEGTCKELMEGKMRTTRFSGELLKDFELYVLKDFTVPDSKFYMCIRIPEFTTGGLVLKDKKPYEFYFYEKYDVPILFTGGAMNDFDLKTDGCLIFDRLVLDVFDKDAPKFNELVNKLFPQIQKTQISTGEGSSKLPGYSIEFPMSRDAAQCDALQVYQNPMDNYYANVDAFNDLLFKLINAITAPQQEEGVPNTDLYKAISDYKEFIGKKKLLTLQKQRKEVNFSKYKNLAKYFKVENDSIYIYNNYKSFVPIISEIMKKAQDIKVREKNATNNKMRENAKKFAQLFKPLILKIQTRKTLSFTPKLERVLNEIILFTKQHHSTGKVELFDLCFQTLIQDYLHLLNTTTGALNISMKEMNEEGKRNTKTFFGGVRRNRNNLINENKYMKNTTNEYKKLLNSVDNLNNTMMSYNHKKQQMTPKTS